MTAAEFNALTAIGRAQAEVLEPDLIAVYESLVVWASRQASRAFRRHAQVLTADAGWQPPLLAQVLDEAELARRVARKTRPIHEQMLVKQAGKVIATAGIDWTVQHPLSQQLLDQLAARSTDLADGIREPVARAIAKSFTEGLSVPDTAKAIREKVEGLKTWQAVMLARNDLIGTANGGALMSARLLRNASEKAPGFKQWLTAGDGLVRKSHAAASGQTVPLDQPFNVGSSSLQHPGDPGGAHADVVNCRCVMLMVDAPKGTRGEQGPSDLLPAYSRRPPEEQTHEETRDEIKRLGGYMGLLRWQIKNGKRDPKDVAKVDAMEERRKLLKARLKEPDLDPDLHPELPPPDVPLTPPLKDESERVKTLRRMLAERGEQLRAQRMGVPTGDTDELFELVQRAGQLFEEEVQARLAVKQAAGLSRQEFELQEKVYVDAMLEAESALGRAETAYIQQAFDRIQMSAGRMSILRAHDLWKINGSHPQLYQDLRDNLRRLPEAKELDKRLKTLKAFREKARPDEKAQMRETVLEALGDVRAMGGKIEWSTKPGTAKKRLVNDVTRYFPSDWIEASNVRPNKLVALTDADAKRYKAGRMSSFYNDDHAFIYNRADTYDSSVPDDPKGHAVAAHELMHRMEHSHPGITRLETFLYEKRTAGEEERHLGPGYDSWEVHRPDKFKEKYMGKDYGGWAWELASVLIQDVVSGRLDLHDTEMRRFIYGLLAII